MKQLSRFLIKLGGLHDATLVAIDWQVESRTLALVLDDLYANFGGLAEFPGRHKAVIKLEGVSRVVFNVEATGRLKVFEILPAKDRADEVLAKFSPGGSIRVRFTSAVFPDALI